MAMMADEVGLDIFGFGEHHRLAIAASAPPVVLATVAQATKHIRLTSTATVLSTADPVCVFEEFATLDVLSDGRAEIIAGRGAFIESFELFGFDLQDYDDLFAEKIDLLTRLNASERITWQGRFRPALHAAQIAPRPMQAHLPIWIAAVGGTPRSAVRAGTMGLPMNLGIFGGASARFVPLVDLYRRAGESAGHDPAALKVAVTSYIHVAKTSQEALETFYPYRTNYFTSLGGDRVKNMSFSRSEYEWEARKENALFVGSPQQIIDKLLYQYELFQHQRFIGQIDIGGMPFDKVAQAIELLGTEIAPVVRREMAKAGQA
jgi:alkanesulfonate monooxygenase SsuD/methylene tetrahydromethanopterin reductase-like flavin-dependent oxidoreductase (luciferase family)